MDGLSLCGSKPPSVQGGSSRPPSFLPSSKPHLVRPPAARNKGALLCGRLTARATHDRENDDEQEHLCKSVWSAKVKLAKESMQQASNIKDTTNDDRLSKKQTTKNIKSNRMKNQNQEAVE